MGTMASGLAHEIKNPLAAIKTLHEYLPGRKDDPTFTEESSLFLVDVKAK